MNGYVSLAYFQKEKLAVQHDQGPRPIHTSPQGKAARRHRIPSGRGYKHPSQLCPSGCNRVCGLPSLLDEWRQDL